MLSKPSRSSRLWAIALPMMLANVSIAVFGLIDAAVVGHLEHEAFLAGVALASVLFDFLYWGVTFLRMGTTGVVAQDFGATNFSDCRRALLEAIAVSLLLAVVILVCHPVIAHYGLSLLDGSAAAREHAETYFSIKIWGAPGVLMTMVMTGWLIGMQRASCVLKLTAVASLLNAGLDLFFVFGLGLGVEGVAMAALISAYFSTALGGFYCVKVLRQHGETLRWSPLVASRVRRFVALNFNILIRTLCLISAFALFTRYGAGQGDTILAANAVLLSFQMLLALSLDGFANALEVLVGEAIGNKDHTGFVSSIKLGTAWSVLGAILFSVSYFLFGQQLIYLLTDIDRVAETALIYLPWMALSPLVAVWCFVFDGVFIGATQGRAMRNSMMFSLLLVFIPALLTLDDFGNHGLWGAFLMFFAARGISMAYLFFVIENRGGFVALDA